MIIWGKFNKNDFFGLCGIFLANDEKVKREDEEDDEEEE
jgi:hypothetical protein